MHQKYPSYSATFFRVFQLFKASFQWILPCSLVTALLYHFLDLGIHSVGSPMDGSFSLNINYTHCAILFLSGLILNGFIFSVVYQQYHHQQIEPTSLLLHSLRRFPIYFLSSALLLGLGGILCILLCSMSVLGGFFWFIAIFSFMVLTIFLLRFALFPILVINKNKSAVESLLGSYHLSKGYLLETFTLIFFYILIDWLIASFLGTFLSAHQANTLKLIVTQSLLPTVLMIHFHNLEAVKGASISVALN